MGSNPGFATPWSKALNASGLQLLTKRGGHNDSKASISYNNL